MAKELRERVERPSLAAGWHHRLLPQDDDRIVLEVCADPDHLDAARAIQTDGGDDCDDRYDRSGTLASHPKGALLDIVDVLSAARAEDANMECCMRVVATKSTSVTRTMTQSIEILSIRGCLLRKSIPEVQSATWSLCDSALAHLSAGWDKGKETLSFRLFCLSLALQTQQRLVLFSVDVWPLQVIIFIISS